MSFRRGLSGITHSLLAQCIATRNQRHQSGTALNILLRGFFNPAYIFFKSSFFCKSFLNNAVIPITRIPFYLCGDIYAQQLHVEPPQKFVGREKTKSKARIIGQYIFRKWYDTGPTSGKFVVNGETKILQISACIRPSRRKNCPCYTKALLKWRHVCFWRSYYFYIFSL